MTFPGINWLRLLGGLAGLLAVVTIGLLVRDRFAQKARADAAAACDKAAETPDHPLIACLPWVLVRIGEQRKASACDASLLPSLTDQSRFAMAQACSAGVKRLVATGDAAAAERDDLARQLAERKAAELKALARAESRATRTNERETHAREAIKAAPRRDDGSIACDAACLRALAQ